MNCVWILEEPVAAVFYRAVMLKAYENSIVKIWLAFDFGGGTLDVALVKVGQGIVELLATDGDHHLGGQDVDHALMIRFIERYKKVYREENDGVEPRINPRIKAIFKQ